jgi:methionyl-tRNA synthetase
MGKDNIPFHTILFPASEFGTGKDWTTVHHIDAIEFLQTEEGKFSKSRKTGLFGDDAIETGIPADVYRYYLIVNRPETSDTVFAWRDLQEKLNKELLANLGNLVNRTLVFIKNYQEGKIHEAVLDETSANFWEYVNEEEVQITDDLEHCREKDALRRIMTLSGRGNQYFQEQQPWKTRTEDPEACRRAMFVLANLIKDIAVLIEPFLPTTSASIFKQLGLPQQTWNDLGNLSVKGHAIGEPAPLFQKLEDKQLDAIKAKLKGKKDAEAKANGAAAPAVAPADLKPLQLRAGTIVEIKQHPNATKLFVETVDFGDHKRTIVSGLVGHYAAEQLQGKTAIWVTNLAPANLRGIESQGMILAGQGAEKVEVIFIDAAPGTALDGMDAAAQITIDDFAKHKLELKEHQLIIDGKPATIKGGQIRSQIIANGKVR